MLVACLLLEGLSNRKRFEAVKVLRRVTKQRGKRGMRRDNLFRCLYRTVQYIVRYGTVPIPEIPPEWYFLISRDLVVKIDYI